MLKWKEAVLKYYIQDSLFPYFDYFASYFIKKVNLS